MYGTENFMNATRTLTPPIGGCSGSPNRVTSFVTGTFAAIPQRPVSPDIIGNDTVPYSKAAVVALLIDPEAEKKKNVAEDTRIYTASDIL